PADGRGDGEHLAHPRTAPRAFVTDHDDVAFVDASARDRVERVLFLVEDPGRTLEDDSFHAGDLRDAPFRREGPAAYGEPAARMDRIVEGTDDARIGRRLDAREILRHRLAGHRRCVAVEQSRVEELA